jgi:uncharacterized protein (TIGR02265 family)
VDERARAIEEVSGYCDLAERIALLPPSANGRGMYFQSIETVLMRAGKLERYRSLFPERFSAVRWYPTHQFLTRLTVAGAILTEAARVHEGMFEIGRQNALAFAESLLGKTLLRLLSRDPKKLLQQGVAARRQSCTVGRWTLAFPDDRSAVMTMREEYLYIESYMLGAAQGTFEAVGIPVKTEAVLEDRFNGRHVLRW